jgi:hypothetical protein
MLCDQCVFRARHGTHEAMQWLLLVLLGNGFDWTIPQHGHFTRYPIEGNDILTTIWH